MVHSTVDKGDDNYRRLNRGRAIQLEERRKRNAIIAGENMVCFFVVHVSKHIHSRTYTKKDYFSKNRKQGPQL